MIPSKLLILALAAATTTLAQQPATKPAEIPAPIERSDPVVDTASQWIGRALYLRCFCADNNLTFDASGHLSGSPKTTDWTLAGFALQKVTRKSPTELEFDGLRVAMRYAPDRHEFDRHNQNDEKVRLLVPDAGNLKELVRSLHAIFSVGIDRPLQLSMPSYWQHYFDPAQPWPKDELTGQRVEAVPTATATAVPPAITHRAPPQYTLTAARDKVTGSVRLHLTVDAEGAPHRIAIDQPLGYGLDEKAAEAASRCRFNTAVINGKPTPAYVVMDEEFTAVPPPPQ